MATTNVSMSVNQKRPLQRQNKSGNWRKMSETT